MSRVDSDSGFDPHNHSIMLSTSDSTVSSAQSVPRDRSLSFRSLAWSVITGSVDVIATRTITSSSTPGMLALHVMAGRRISGSIFEAMPLSSRKDATDAILRIVSDCEERGKEYDEDDDIKLLIDVALHVGNGCGFVRILSIDAPHVACVLKDVGRSQGSSSDSCSRSSDTVEGSLLLILMSHTLHALNRHAKAPEMIR